MNWRVTARRGDLWVNQRHPDRNADVVLFLDAFDAAACDDAVRAASVLAHRYLQARDRVGLVSFGGTVRHGWPRARAHGRATGWPTRSSRARCSRTRRTRASMCCPATCCHRARSVLALSPLVDERVIGALVELRRHGRDVAVIEVGPTRARSGATPGVEGDLAWRLWQLERRSVQGTGCSRSAQQSSRGPRRRRKPARGAVRERATLDAVGEGLAACRRRSQRVG